ncbi:hypothetical protein SO694_00058166 [Aureococcus anophagefferens]|uniref:Uncharacterized protein n=1 Tax=Aureococcus anophagefferens TaxID=44056 RepID=A0ABR1FZG2_AURAN
MMTPNNKENAKANILAMFDEDSSVDGDSPKSALRAKTPKTPGSAKPRTPGSKPCSDDIVAITDFDVAASPAPEKAPAAPVAVVSAERPTPERPERPTPERPERPTPERRSLLASKDELVVMEVIMEEPASPDDAASPLPARRARAAPIPGRRRRRRPRPWPTSSRARRRAARARPSRRSRPRLRISTRRQRRSRRGRRLEPPKKGSPSPSKKGRGWKLSFPRFSRKAPEETAPPPVEVSVVEAPRGQPDARAPARRQGAGGAGSTMARSALALALALSADAFAPAPKTVQRVAPMNVEARSRALARRRRPHGAPRIPAADSTILVQGGSLRTWSYKSPLVDQVQVVLSTEGRPLGADLELWHGPDNTPCKMRVYVENGQLRPFSAVVATPRGPNTVAIRNIGQIEFPIAADGGALRTYPFDPLVNSVEVLLRTDGRPLNARIELLQGPNNNKQVIELYTEDGFDRPFFAILETPGSGNVVRIVNTAPVEFPMTAAVVDTILVQGGSLRTWSYKSPLVDQVQVVLSTEGRPLDADLELWHGPDNTPCKMRVYVENGQLRPFSAVIATPRGPNTVAIRNIGQLEFPIAADVYANDVEMASEECVNSATTIQGGALRTYPFDPLVDSVEVLLRTDGRPLNARIELLQGPNNNKQVVELYTEDGLDRPFFAVLETPGSGNVVRVVNTAPVEFPMTAAVVPHSVEEGAAVDARSEVVIGGDIGW